MTDLQKVIKYLAMAFAVFLIVSIIGGALSVLGLFGGFFTGAAVGETIKTYTVSPEIHSLEMKIRAADLTIRQGETFSVESNLAHLTVEEKNGVLTVKETKSFGGTYTGAVLTLCIPENTVFEKATISTGAGRLTADCLSADTVDLELGAGEVTIDTLIATAAADIDGGAGKITISDGALHHLDVDMGVGQFNLTSALTGKSEFDLGVGESNITVIGNQEAYTLDIEKGLGSITVDGTHLSDIKGFGNGQNRIEIDGGIGAVRVKFRETDAE